MLFIILSFLSSEGKLFAMCDLTKQIHFPEFWFEVPDMFVIALKFKRAAEKNRCNFCALPLKISLDSTTRIHKSFIFAVITIDSHSFPLNSYGLWHLKKGYTNSFSTNSSENIKKVISLLNISVKMGKYIMTEPEYPRCLLRW